MTNLVNAEKSLKHWLKNKVTVTTATVVGFLIMGTVSFGAITIGPDTSKNSTVTDNEVIISGIKNQPETWGKIEVTGSSGWRITGIEGKINDKIIVNNNGKISAIAEVGQGSNKLEANGINLFNVNKINITNNGEIFAEAKDGNANGISITYDSKNFLKEKSSITNEGTITAISGNGNSASAISVTGTLNADLDITNNGTLSAIRNQEASGTGARAVVNINTSGTGKVTFTNTGEIRVEKGTGIYAGANTTVTNSGTLKLDSSSLAINNTGGIVNNSGNITITDKSIDELKDFDINQIFSGSNITFTGQILDKTGEHVTSTEISKYIGGPLNTTNINKAGESLSSVTIGKQIETKITNETKDSIKLKSLNIIGDIGIVANKNNDTISEAPIIIENTTINLDNKGILSVGGHILNNNNIKEVKGVTLSIIGNKVNKFDKKTAVNLTNGSTLSLRDVIFDGGVSSDDNASNKLEVYGNTSINGELGVSTINVGTGAKAVGSDKLTLASSSSFTKETTLTNEGTGTTVFQIDKDGNNALANSTAKVTVKGNMDFDTTNLTTDKKVELNGKNENGEVKHVLGDYTNKNTGVYTTTLDKTNNILNFEYNKNLFTNTTLNNINNNAQIVNGNFSQDVAEREIQLDKIYAQNIYTETVKAFYDTLKSTENEVLSLNHEVKAGELKADGKVLYSKNEYTKDGIVGSYDVKAETSGLLASLEYGVTDTMRTGVVFAGSKQDVDAISGSADADIFYLGVYGNKTYGNYDFTAGLGYQFGKYEADSNIGNVTTSDKYDTNAFTGYVQGKYTFNFEEGITIQPKAKLGYTYLKQDTAKDSYFGVSDAEITTYDTEVGVDVVKSIQFKKSKLDVTFGTSYVRTMGDTDEMFKGHFYGENTTSHFNVLGAELSENVIKFNLGAEIENENGFFYNGGFTYEFGGNNTEAYGVNAGVGYKF